MSSPELADLEEIRALIASGRHLGVLTHGEVATVVAELDFDETDIEELHSFLEGCEIELVDDVGPQPAAPPPDQAQVGSPRRHWTSRRTRRPTPFSSSSRASARSRC